MKYISILFYLILFSSLSLSAQNSTDGYKIKFNIENYQSDTLVIGYYYGDRQLVKDSLVSDKEKGVFFWEGEESLDPGIYMMLVQPSEQFVQFMIPQEDQEFELKTDINDLSNIEYKGSKDNELFVEYLSFIRKQNASLEELKATIETKKEAGEDTTKDSEKLYQLDDEVFTHLEKLVKENPNTVTGLLIKSNFQIDIPEYNVSQDSLQLLRYLYFREHYFDHIEMENPATLRTPFLHQKVDYYINKLTSQHPDSVIIAVDRVLDMLKPSTESFTFYTSHFLNTYANSKIVGMDKVYVHIVDKYYKSGIADWVTEESLIKIVDRSEKIKPVLIGKIAPDVTLYREDGSTMNIHDVQADYTVLLFWAPDCGHCKKSMPDVIKFYDENKSKGVELIAICTKHQSKYASCWEAVKEKDMSRFLNLGDQYHKSRFKLKYNVSQTPKIFILDEKKEIIMKNIGADQLQSVIDEIIEMKKKQEK